MLFTPYEIDLLMGSIQMYDSCHDLLSDEINLSASCRYKLCNLNSLTRFTEEELTFLTGAVYYSINSGAVIVDKCVRSDLEKLIWRISAID
jgi:hypothetical protein